MGKRKKYEYYRFTVWTSIGYAIKWFKHFVELDIPCCITTQAVGDGTKKLPQDFAVWREGVELVDETDEGYIEAKRMGKKVYGPNEEPFHGVMMASYKWGKEWKL